MTGDVRQERAAIELEVVSTPGVRALYPASALPGAPRVVLSERAGAKRCELRIAADIDVPALPLIRAVADAARDATGDPGLELHIEIASFG